jgi:hypothetical protein
MPLNQGKNDILTEHKKHYRTLRGGFRGELVLKPTVGVSRGSQVDFTLLLA